jgi:NADH dehydrogenase FAD-containing subunit
MHRTVIIGGGFGGLYAARNLQSPEVHVTLLDRRNFHLFQPLLYQVATGAERYRGASARAAAKTKECRGAAG